MLGCTYRFIWCMTVPLTRATSKDWATFSMACVTCVFVLPALMSFVHASAATYAAWKASARRPSMGASAEGAAPTTTVCATSAM